MTFKELRQQSGMTQQQFADYFGIPKRTVEDWERGARQCNQYLLDLMEYKLNIEQSQIIVSLPEGSEEETAKLISEHLKDKKINKYEPHGRWEFIREPNTVDTCGNPVYYARCTECGFVWTDLYAVKNHFNCCPGCGIKLDK